MPMLSLHVLHLRLPAVEQAISVPAVMVIGTLPIMLFARIGAPKVEEVAIVAGPGPVGVGIVTVFVLFQCPVAWEPSSTAIIAILVVRRNRTRTRTRVTQ
jgi:hypothetical protein